MTNKQVRVPMSPHTEQVLEALALQYGCLYGGKPHISGLLLQIADGRLKINKEVSYPSPDPRLLFLKMRIWLPVDLRGMFACIAGTIADFEGNIFQAEDVSEVDRRGVASILFSMPEDGNLSGLMTALQKICIQDIADFNHDREIIKAISNTRGVTIDDEMDESELGTDKNRLAEQIYRKSLVQKLSCTIALRIVAKNQVGLLAKVTRAIAEQGFLIDRVRQDFDAIDRLDIIELLISLEPHASSKISYDIEKMKTIANTIGQISGIKDVRRLGMDSIWN
ncbi:MAG: hypothetical protein WBD58_21420 [Geitlerinemataceae cyanobacterium]